MAEKSLNPQFSEKLESFMNGGTVRVFECGESRPEHLQDRPFFDLLPSGQTTYISAGAGAEDYTVSVGEPPKEYILNTENHKFFQQMEERFRNVRPGMTLFVIDPDVVMGRYATDFESNRSLEKSMYLHIVEKLEKSDAYNKTPIKEEDVPQVIQASIKSSNAFSSTNPVNVTRDNLSGERNISLVVGDNPDTLVDDMFYHIPGVKERMEKEGVTRRQLQQFTLYHEFGHALDPAHKGGFDKRAVQNETDRQLARHRTECLADAHAVLQLARDYGSTDTALLIGDVRIENTMHVLKKYENTDSPSPIERALDKIAQSNLHTQPTDSPEIIELKNLQIDNELFQDIQEAGASLAYYTTGVIDAAIKIANEKLADGSLMKMSDLEVLDMADSISRKYGLTKEEMTKLRIDIVKKQPNAIAESMKMRAEKAYNRMPVPREQIEAKYAKAEAMMAEKRVKDVEEMLGIINDSQAQGLENMDPAVLQKMIIKLAMLAEWKEGVHEKIAKNGADKDALITVLTEEKESIRKASVNDIIGMEKFATLNEEFIGQAPAVLAKAKANQVVFKQIQSIPAEPVEATGKNGLIEYISAEMDVMNKMIKILDKASARDLKEMTPKNQAAALQEDSAAFDSVIAAERKVQTTAAVMAADPETAALASPSLKKKMQKKAEGKHPDFMTDFQMNFGSMHSADARKMREEIVKKKFVIISDLVKMPEVMKSMATTRPLELKEAISFAQDYIKASSQKKETTAKTPKIDFSKLSSKATRLMTTNR